MPRDGLPLHGLDARIIGPTSFEAPFNVIMEIEALVVARVARVSTGRKIFLDLALHGRVPVVLDRVVGPSRQLGRDLGPLVPDPRVLH